MKRENFTLPDDVEKDKIEATMENGIMTLYLPKQAPIPEELFKQRIPDPKSDKR